MKVQELDEPVAANAPAETPPGPLDHRVVVPLDAVAPAWRQARLGTPEPAASDPSSNDDKEST